MTEYQIQVAQKKRKEREARSGTSDWTTFDVTLGGRKLTALRKRHVIYQTFRFLVEQGIAPEKIAERCGIRANRTCVSVDGKVNAEDFHRLAKDARAREGRSIDPKRFFSDDDELLHSGGRTYVFSNQWGGSHWKQAMVNLCDVFSDNEIKFVASE